MRRRSIDAALTRIQRSAISPWPLAPEPITGLGERARQRSGGPSALGIMPTARRHCPEVIKRRGVALSLIAVATIAAAYTAVPRVATITGRLISACAAWITLAGALETLSAVGFVLVFKLLFGARLGWRQTFGAGLRALGASTLLPAGPVVGPAMGARSARDGQLPPTELARSTIAFAVITVLPSIVVVGALGLLLWLGILDGPRDVLRTLLPAGLALVAIAGVCVIGRRSV